MLISHDEHLVRYWEDPQWSANLLLVDGYIAGFLLIEGSELPGIIRAVEGMSVTVDFNHPLAGHTVTFEVEILGVDDEEKVS